MKKIRGFFFSENFQYLEVKFSIYLNRHVFVMTFKTHKGHFVNPAVCFGYSLYTFKTIHTVDSLYLYLEVQGTL